MRKDLFQVNYGAHFAFLHGRKGREKREKKIPLDDNSGFGGSSMRKAHDSNFCVGKFW
jgi:hypothetical protein